jgi:hypothetical protein
MMLDQSLVFVSPAGAAQSVVGAAGATIVFNSSPTAGVIDVAGVGVGLAPPNIIGNASLFGEDVGLGVWKVDVQIDIGTAFTTGNSATAEFIIQGAPDTGAGGGYQPGTWEDFGGSGQHAASELTATGPNQPPFRFAMPPAPPATQTPRFYRLVMKVPSGTNMSAGTVSGAFLVQGRDDFYSAKAASSNYTVR